MRFRDLLLLAVNLTTLGGCAYVWFHWIKEWLS